MPTLSIVNLLIFLIFIAPGFVFLQDIKRKRPLELLSTFDVVSRCIFISFLVHSLLFAVIAVIPQTMNILISIMNFDFRNIHSNIEIYSFLLYCAFFLIYVFIAIFIALLVAHFYRLYLEKYGLDTLPVFYRAFLPEKNVVFLKVIMKDSKIYAGQLKYNPRSYELTTITEKDIYIAEPKYFDGVKWIELKADGILLNTRDILSIEVKAGKKQIKEEI